LLLAATHEAPALLSQMPHLLLLLLHLLHHCPSSLLCQLLLNCRYLHHLHLQHQLCWQSPDLQQPLSPHHPQLLLLVLQMPPSPVTPTHLHAPLHLQTHPATQPHHVTKP
jgi:hypothetical protein